MAYLWDTYGMLTGNMYNVARVPRLAGVLFLFVFGFAD
jgi:hypothetical protein